MLSLYEIIISKISNQTKNKKHILIQKRYYNDDGIHQYYNNITTSLNLIVYFII